MIPTMTMAEYREAYLKGGEEEGATESIIQEVERWIAAQPESNSAKVEEMRNFMATAPREQLLPFMLNLMSDDEVMEHIFQGMLLAVGKSDQMRWRRVLVRQWLTLEQEPDNQVASFMAKRVERDMADRGMKFDKKKELERKKLELETPGIGDVDEDSILEAAGVFIKSADTSARLDALRYIASLCAPHLKYHLKETDTLSMVKDMLEAGKEDSESSIRQVADEGLDLLRKRAVRF